MNYKALQFMQLQDRAESYTTTPHHKNWRAMEIYSKEEMKRKGCSWTVLYRQKGLESGRGFGGVGGGEEGGCKAVFALRGMWQAKKGRGGLDPHQSHSKPQ